jgi:HD-like signal output (HDOD) protein
MRDGESLFLAGLLHGVGRLVFYVRRPEPYREALGLMEPTGLSLEEAERRVFGFGHAEVGAALLDAWNLPDSIHVPVRYQLDPAAAPAFAREVAVIHLASQMACAIAPCLKTGREADTYAPDSQAVPCMQLLGLTPAALKEIGFDAMAASLEVIEIIRPSTSIIY